MSRFVRFFGLALLLAGVGHSHASTKVKVLLIGKRPDHPFGTHMYLHTCKMLSRCLELTEGVQAVVSDGWPKDPDMLRDVRTIVVYSSPAAEMLLESPHRDELARLMDQGVGLVTLHWASSVRMENLERLGPTWLSYLGGTWVSNVGLHTGESTLKKLQPDHPICRGWSEYVLHDEFYLNPTLTAQATPLLEVQAPDKPVVVGWAFERSSKGRSFGTTLGHFYRNFQQEPFRRMVVNAILWTAKVDVPEGGANVALSAEELALSPEP